MSAGAPQPARIAVVIVNYNAGAYLLRCLAALAQQTLAPDRIVLFDNASTDGSTEAAVGKFPQVVPIRSPCNLGFAAANNRAVAQLQGFGWVALLNPDAFPHPCWLEALWRAASQHPHCAMFASRMLKAADPQRLDGAGDLYHVNGLAWRRYHGCLHQNLGCRDEEVFGACAAAALYRRADFIAYGGFDESYFCYMEDVDLSFRMRLAGRGCLYVANAVVCHVGSAIAGRHSAFALYHGHRNLVWTYVKNMHDPLFWRYLPYHILLNLVALIWFALRGRGGVILRAKWHALRGLSRAWAERKRIQATRVASVAQIAQLLEHGLVRSRRSRPG